MDTLNIELPRCKPTISALYEAGSTLNDVYSPTTAIVSRLYVRQNGESAGDRVVGNEGAVGVSARRWRSALASAAPSSTKYDRL